MAVIEYNKKMLDLLNVLSKIRQSIIIGKSDSKVVVENKNGLSTIQYKLSAPISYFNIDKDSLGIFNYPEFYQLMQGINSPVLSREESFLIIKEGEVKAGEKKTSSERTLKYNLSDSNIINVEMETNIHSDDEVVYNFGEEELKMIGKMIGANYVNSDTIRFSNKGKNITVETYNSIGKSKNKWANTYSLMNEPDCDVDIEISAEAFKLIPEGSYKVTIGTKAVFFTLQDSDIDLELLIKRK